MSLYKRGFIVTVMLAVISLMFAIVLNYGINEQFWCNVCLGIFGSSVLTAITSIIGYYVERKRVLEEFYHESIKFIKEINKYQNDWVLDDKLKFWIGISDYDSLSWDSCYGQMDFFNSGIREKIYYKIYEPLMYIRNEAQKHAWHFCMHINGTGINEAVMQHFVEELEEKILSKKNVDYYNENEVKVTAIRNRIVDTIFEELNSWYYKVMYFTNRKDMEKK